MNTLRTIWWKLRSLGQSKAVKQEIDEELRFHIEQRTAENIAAGMSSEEAAREARRRFGNVQSVREECRDVRGASFGEEAWRDICFGARQLRKNPGFTAVAVLTLGLGIGANTAIFTLVDVVLLKMLPVRDPQDLVFFAHHGREATGETQYSRSSNYPMYEFLRDQNRTLAGLVAFWGMNLRTGTGAAGQSVSGQFVTPNYFSVLGVTPVIGRTFSPEDENDPAVAIISYRIWQRNYGGEPSVIGRSLIASGKPLTIIGVAPPDFLGLEAGSPSDVTLLLAAQPSILSEFGNRLAMREGWWSLTILGRLKPGVTVEETRAELDVLLQQWNVGERVPEMTIHRSFARVELPPASKGLDELRRRFSKPLLVLTGIVGLVLLIACANIANLLLARAASRRKEIAVRLAIGASRSRLIRQLLTESLVLAVGGGAAGVLLGWWGSQVLVTFISSGPVSVDLQLRPDLRVLAFTTALSMLTGILVGLAPALRGSAIELFPALKESFTAFTGQGTRWSFGQSLVAGQLALSLCLLIGAGLFVSSLRQITSLDSGFRVENLLLVGFDASGSGYKLEQMAAFNQRALERVQGLPGVRSASATSLEPLSGDDSTRFFNSPDFSPRTLDDSVVHQNVIGPTYFETMGIPVLRGREFDTRDDANAPKVAVINETLARFYFGDADPVGKLAWMSREASGPPITIVGVVKDSKQKGLRDAPPRMIYLPFTQAGAGSMTLVVRAERNPAAVAASLRRPLSELSPDVSVREIKTAQVHLERGLVQERLLATLSGFFGPLALLLAALGLYGVLAYGVAQRTREIGVRVALGAQRHHVFGLVLRQGMKLVTVGVLVGLGGAFVLTRLLQSFLFGISPNDPFTFAIIPLVLAAVAMLACYLPARRAARVDPIVALRYE